MTVFYVHTGNPYYLKYSVAQTREKLSTARIILLGDESNCGLSEFAEHHPLSELTGATGELEQRYVHLSPNSREFELFCIKRWLLMAEFVRRNQVEGPLLHLDSDVLVYDDVFSALADQGVELATTRVLGPAFTYFGDNAVLFGLEQFITDTYRDPTRLGVLERMYETGETPFFLQGKYVSDMQLLGLYSRTLTKTVDLFQLTPQVVVDYAFHTAEGFSFNPYKRIKRIWWRQGQPNGKRAGRWVRFAGLHFQVGSKIYIPLYYRGRRRFADRWWFRLVHARGAITTLLKFVIDRGRKWRAQD